MALVGREKYDGKMNRKGAEGQRKVKGKKSWGWIGWRSRGIGRAGRIRRKDEPQRSGGAKEGQRQRRAGDGSVGARGALVGREEYDGENKQQRGESSRNSRGAPGSPLDM